ncbi:MAG: DUF4157 domain-containing protein [Dehalococcoidia bacterium]
MTRPGDVGVDPITQLQQVAGNRAVQRLVQRSANDTSGQNMFNLPGVELPAPGGGSPLPSGTREEMESAFGSDFSSVRVHEGSAADAVGAVAYTQGTDIHFAPGRYNADSTDGQRLLAHELTHVVQQKAGKVASPQGYGAPVNADPGLEKEADLLGVAAVNGEPVTAKGLGDGVQRSVDGVVQRAFNGKGKQSDPEIDPLTGFRKTNQTEEEMDAQALKQEKTPLRPAQKM